MEVHSDNARSRMVFFDAVGTLIYPWPPVGEVYARAALRAGGSLAPDEIERRFRAAFREQEEQDRARGYQTSEAREYQRWQAIVAAVFHDQPDPLAPFEELWHHFARPDAWACYPDVSGCLEALVAQGLEVGLASNHDSRLRQIVPGLPALRRCSPLVISAEVGWRKPARQFFEAMLALAQRPAREVLLVGDDLENDYRGGEGAGVGVFLLARRSRPEGVRAIASLLDLPPLLQPSPEPTPP